MAETIDYRWLDEVGAGSIFFPRGDDRSAPQGAYDLLIPVDEGASVAARFYVHDPGAPSILYFHGNGEVAADHDDIAPLYGQIGVNLFVAEFRGYGQSGGSPTFAHLMGDASPTAAFFHEHLDAGNFSPARYLMGRSLGNHPALELAANAPQRFSGLVIESGAWNLARLFTRFGVMDDDRARSIDAAHNDKLRGITLPTLIIHGANDDLVPVAQAIGLNELLGEVAKELLLVEGAGHNDLLWVDAPAYFAAIRSLIETTA